MKNTFKILLVVIMLLAVVFTLWACKNDEVKVQTSLPIPTEIGASGSTISWSSVVGASSYEVIVSDGEPNVTENTYYNLDLSSIGTYIIKIRAVGVNTEGTTIYSDYVSYSFVKSNKLATPVVSVSDKTVTWTAVDNAATYNVRVLNSNKEVLFENTQSELTISLDDEKYTAVGKYTIQVKAIPEASKTEYANSDAGVNYYKVTQKLATPSISNISATSIRWTSISGISSYKLYLYKVDGDVETLIDTYSTTSNSYSFTYMDLEDEGKYYCLLEAIGDDEIYLNSDKSTRDKNYDIYVIPTLDASTLQLYQDGTTWKLKFKSQNVDMLASFTISLSSKKADSSSSMATIDKTVWVSDGDLTYTLAAGEYDEKRTYYVEKAAGYVKNTAAYDDTKTYYTFDGATHTEFTGSLSQYTEYFLLENDTYYEAAKGTATYTKVDITSTTFNTRYNYYKKIDDTTYELITSDYENVGTYDSSTFDADQVYLALNPSYDSTNPTSERYISKGKPSDSTWDSSDTTTVYYVYHAFTAFDPTQDYYTASYASFEESNYTANTFYTITAAEFITSIDDLFFTVDSSDNYTYKRSDISYYGKSFTITVDAQGITNRTMTGDAITCDDKYVSYRKPYQIDDSVAYADSQLKGYFDTEEEYTAFVTAHDDYYVVESVGDLQYINYAPTSNFVQLQDIDMQGYYWSPIKTFSGIYDGNNHLISNPVYETIKISDYTYAGLFAKLTGATIKNAYVIGASSSPCITGMVGGLAAYVEGNTTIQNCYVKGTFENANEVGGIIGEIYDDSATNTITFLNCQAEVTIKNSQYAGGIVAVATVLDTLNITNCIANGSITVSDDYYQIGSFTDLGNNSLYLLDSTKIYAKDGSTYKYLGTYSERSLDAFKDGEAYYSAYYVRLISENPSKYGGIAATIQRATINNSTASVEINVSASHSTVTAGGFVGHAIFTTINNSSSGYKYTRDVAKVMGLTASGDSTSRAGGFVGYAENSTFVNDYSTIKVSARDYFGGFVGTADTSTMTRCYVTGGVSEQTATHKGPFYGNLFNMSDSDITNCYIYDRDNLDAVIPHVATAQSLDEIYTAFYGIDSTSIAKIEGYNDQPCIVGNPYTTTYVDEIKASGSLKISPYLAIYDTTKAKVEVLNMYESEDTLDIVIGDKTAKGTVLWVLQLKVDENDDGIDDGTGARVVIYVTVT